MRIRTLLWLATLASVSLLAACSRDKSASGAGSADPKQQRIAIVPKGTTHEFWKAVHAGAAKASAELGGEIIWKGPIKEDDLKGQIDIVQTFVAQGVSGILLAPLNDKALVNAVKGSVRSRIPVVVIDSALQGDHHVSFVATDNVAAGELAGKGLAKLLDGKGKVLVLRYLEGSASTTNREKGFLKAIAAHDGIEIVSDNRYGGATTESAFEASENLLLAKRAAEGEVTGIFCPNESTTFGMLRALQKLRLAGKIKFIGFDVSDKLIKAVRDGQIDGLVLQDPFQMGYLGLKTMLAHLRGEAVDPVIDTGSQIVGKENIDDPSIQAVLKPDLKKWLKQ